MTVKCEKCGADVELLDGAKSAKCEKCGAEVTVKEEAAAEATEEKKEEAAEEKKPLTPAEKTKKIVTLVIEIIIICAALAMVPRLTTKLHQHRMDSAGMPVNQDNSNQLFEYTNVEDETVVLPGCFTSIGEFAFEKCKALKSVTVTTAVKSIGNGAFKGVESLEEFKMSGGAGAYVLLDYVTLSAFKKDNTPCVIGDSAFEDCKKLKSVGLPDGITSIGQYAFADCKSLTEIRLPETVTTIGTLAFARSGLKSIVIPSSVKEVGKMAFAYTKLEEINVPKHFTDAQIASWGIDAAKCKVNKF